MNVEIGQDIMKVKEDIPEKSTIKEEIVNTWQLEIGSIGLKAEIAEGTTQEILNKYIGHFENTSKETGNIGLAAHNRGYEVNYFERLKELKQGDEIKYQYNQYQNVYEVYKNIIIKDDDWKKLEQTEDNMLTLITCVENQPEYRRCIQAREKEPQQG